MERSSSKDSQLNSLLSALSGKIGVSPEELKKAAGTGRTDMLLKNMNASDRSRFESVLNNREKMEKLMQSPQAKALYEKLSGMQKK